MASQAEQVIDLTEQGQSLRYVEVLTEAGVVRVNVNLVNVITGARVVGVEVEPYPHWRTRTEERAGGRTDISLIKAR